MGSLGAVLARDDKGGTLLAYSTFFEFDDPILAESATLLEGIRLARDHGFRHVAFGSGLPSGGKSKFWTCERSTLGNPILDHGMQDAPSRLRYVGD
ncbi:hypothetical protein TorRG33x02_113010 [Trema orientale]|uniref:RNase H type-1 domain-containing protein n=1 Tax=Trema orientale TaxID=63057 RepID=A0A2P5F5E9_TREOI|nr:hypothetical protein TorRG33x02_113010 [Trema orientale]